VRDAWVIAGVGIAGTLARIALTDAFRRGEASLIAPPEYTALIRGCCWTSRGGARCRMR
jgi:hypothetical protein